MELEILKKQTYFQYCDYQWQLHTFYLAVVYFPELWKLLLNTESVSSMRLGEKGAVRTGPILLLPLP